MPRERKTTEELKKSVEATTSATATSSTGAGVAGAATKAPTAEKQNPERVNSSLLTKDFIKESLDRGEAVFNIVLEKIPALEKDISSLRKKELETAEGWKNFDNIYEFALTLKNTLSDERIWDEKTFSKLQIRKILSLIDTVFESYDENLKNYNENLKTTRPFSFTLSPKAEKAINELTHFEWSSIEKSHPTTAALEKRIKEENEKLSVEYNTFLNKYLSRLVVPKIDEYLKETEQKNRMELFPSSPAEITGLLKECCDNQKVGIPSDRFEKINILAKEVMNYCDTMIALGYKMGEEPGAQDKQEIINMLYKIYKIIPAIFRLVGEEPELFKNPKLYGELINVEMALMEKFRGAVSEAHSKTPSGTPIRLEYVSPPPIDKMMNIPGLLRAINVYQQEKSASSSPVIRFGEASSTSSGSTSSPGTTGTHPPEKPASTPRKI